jgi:GrpB-like predicted nucleotidyltransferase (UPF0157 family)
MDVTRQLCAIFENTGLGLTRGEVRLVPSDPRWLAIFERVRARLRTVLPDTVVAIEHIGSTAVPGLPAKPILDIALGVRHAAEPEPIGEALEEQGLIFRGRAEDGSLDLNYGLEHPPRHRLMNAHLVGYDGPQWRAYLSFRDHLREDATARDEYAALKARLAAGVGQDRRAYVAGKSGFIASASAEPQSELADRARS